MKTTVRTVISLLLFFILSGMNCSKPEVDTAQKTPVKKPPEAIQIVNQGTPEKLTVYYFHTNYRCKTCNKFESLTKEVVEQDFKESADDRNIEFKLVNIENDSNKHYIDQYQIVTKTLILSLEGKELELQWKNLEKIWTLVREGDGVFKNYIRQEIKVFLNQVS